MAGYDPIAYTYEADHHCPACTEERFGRHFETGIIADECDDTEGNPVGAVFGWDEWWQADGECETLSCGTCGGEIDTAHADPHSEECEEYPAPMTLDELDAESDYFDAAQGLYWYAANHHEGQSSQLYSILSAQLDYRPAPSERAPNTEVSQGVYAALVAGLVDASDVLDFVNAGYAATHD